MKLLNIHEIHIEYELIMMIKRLKIWSIYRDNGCISLLIFGRTE